MTKDEALKLALEALELTANKFQKQREAITAIKEVLARQDVRDEIDRGAKTLRETYLAQLEQVCRDDGRCQYAIDHGAEGLGHCPKGKCVCPS